MGKHAPLGWGVALALSLLSLSCSSSSNPVDTSATTNAPTPPPAIGLPDATGVFGAWNLALDPGTLNATLEPVRDSAAFGDSWWLNATGFLDGAPCKDCLSVEAASRDVDGNIVLTFRARHPFQPGDPDLPVSGANRLDLHVFDAQLLLAADLGVAPGTFTAGTVNAPSRLVLNAAGYSGLLSGVVSTIDPSLTSTIFPYVTLGEDRTAGNFASSNPGGFADVTAPTGHNVFPMGADVLAPVTLGLTAADGQVRLTILFTCSYGQSAVGRPNRLNPVYALPEYNAKAPWRVEVEVPDGTNGLLEGNTTSSAELQVRVWDWQAGAVVDGALADISAVRSASEPSTVELSIPGILSSTLTLGAPTGGTGPLDDPLLYNTLFLNQLGASGGDYVAIVKVSDNRAPGGNAGGQPDGLSSINGSSIDPVSIASFATYQLATVSVEDAPTRQVVAIDITPTARQIIAQGAGEAIPFTAIGTFDMPPYNEDITATAVWDSSLLDVGTFSSNTFTGVGMGTTEVTATLDAVTSAPTTVIVKPVQFQTLHPTFSQGIDANQDTGDVYMVASGGIQVYDDGGNAQGFIGGTLSGRGLTVNEANGNIFIFNTFIPGFDSVQEWTPGGALVSNWGVSGYCSLPNGMHITEDGELWSADFCNSGPNDLFRFDPSTGTELDGWGDPRFAASIGIDGKDDLLVIANPGLRPTLGLIVARRSTQTIDAIYSEYPSPTVGQNSYVALDRDGYIHMSWQGDGAGVPVQVQVYEFVPPSTLSVLYTYKPSQNDAWIEFGLGISRPNNVSILNCYSISAPPGMQMNSTWWH